MSPADVQQNVIDSGLRGRGGAGFPTGKKWSFVPRDLPGPRYLICNCDEMEPGTYKDRVLLERNPHLLVEGMALACYALGVQHAFIFVRHGYEQAAENLRTSIAAAHRSGFLGTNILGSGFSPGTRRTPVGRPLHLRRGNRPDQRPGGNTRQSAGQAPLSGNQGAMGAADRRQQRGDPGKYSGHHRRRAALVEKYWRPYPRRPARSCSASAGMWSTPTASSCRSA